MEENVLITCACIPTLGPFVTFIQGKDLRSALRTITQSWSTQARSDRIALRDYGSVGKMTDSTTKISSVKQNNDDLERGLNE